MTSEPLGYAVVDKDRTVEGYWNPWEKDHAVMYARAMNHDPQLAGRTPFRVVTLLEGEEVVEV